MKGPGPPTPTVSLTFPVAEPSLEVPRGTPVSLADLLAGMPPALAEQTRASFLEHATGDWAELLRARFPAEEQALPADFPTTQASTDPGRSPFAADPEPRPFASRPWR